MKEQKLNLEKLCKINYRVSDKWTCVESHKLNEEETIKKCHIPEYCGHYCFFKAVSPKYLNSIAYYSPNKRS